MITWLKNIPLRRAWYGLIILASLLPALILAPWLANKAHGLLLEQAMLKEEIFHKEIETRLEMETDRLVSVLQNKSDPIAFFSENGQLERIRQLLGKIIQRESDINTISVYDVHGDILLSAQQGVHTPANIATDSPAFVIPMHKRVFIGAPSRLQDKHFEFLISVPLITSDHVVGVMVGTIHINAFWNHVRKRTKKHHSKIYLVDGRGSLMNQPEDSQYLQQGDLLSNYAIVRSLLAHKGWHKTEAYMGMDGTNVFGIGTRVHHLEWGIISEIPESRIDSPIISALITLTVVVVMLHVVFGLFSLLFTRRLLSPISELAKVMRRASKGDYTQAFARPSVYREINDLGQSFNTMIHEIETREIALKKLTHAMEQLGESLIITDRNGIIEYVNPAFTAITGYSHDEAIGSSPSIISSGTQSKSFYKQMWATILAGEVWEGRLVNRKKDGSLYPALVSISPVHDSGEITHFIAVEQDMSDLDMLEEQFRQAQKMESIGTLVGGIAHDFNNMLAGIMGNTYLAKRAIESGSSHRAIEKLSTIDELSQSASVMISHLLTFARKGVVTMSTLSMAAFIKETLDIVRVTVSEDIQLVYDITTDDMFIEGDATQLQQVLVNLLNNARDAVKDEPDPCIKLALSRFIADDSFCNAHDIDSQGMAFAHLSISDNGYGIAQHHLDQIFEPFFTTKGVGEGTGLGLSMVYGAVQSHSGIIEVKSKPGQGTVVDIYLPLIDVPKEEAEPVVFTVAESVKTKGETILLADDELYVRETTSEVLESMGYKVLQAKDGKEAFDIFKRHQHDISLIILDVIMPHLGGIQLAEQIRKTDPDVPLVFVTGYDNEQVLSGNVNVRHSAVLTKPVDFDALSHAIRKLLD